MKYTSEISKQCPTCDHFPKLSDKERLHRNVEIAKNRIFGATVKECSEAYTLSEPEINSIVRKVAERRGIRGVRRWEKNPEYGFGWASIPKARKNPDHWLSWIKAVYEISENP